jgi:hypothetical protein
MGRRLLLFLIAAAAAGVAPPVAQDSLRFAVIGDTGTGDRPAIEVAQQMAKARAVFPFELAVMMGDNLYGRERPKDYESKFERPFKPLLDAGVKFYASLGNHDEPTQANYKLFNMNGQRYYSFKPRDGVRFFALDSNYMDKRQLEWLEKELKGSGSEWKICFFHHPIYSSGKRHGPSEDLRALIEPLFVKYNVSLVLQGHEHFYERIHPQHGIPYFIVGGSAKLRSDGIGQSKITAKGFDEDRSFTLMEIVKDELHFQTLSRTGKVIDSGSLRRRQEQKPEGGAAKN